MPNFIQYNISRTEKICTHCNKMKPLNKFHVLTYKQRTALDSICQQCYDYGARRWKDLRTQAQPLPEEKETATRICTECGKEKLVKLFAQTSNWHRCLDCYNKYNRDYYNKDVIKSRKLNALHRRGLHKGSLDAPKWMRMCSKNRAMRNGIPFSLEKEDIVIPEICPILKIKLTTPGEGVNDASPTIDRIDPKKGYIKGNIAVISMRANRLKNDATVAEIEKILAWMKSVGAP